MAPPQSVGSSYWAHRFSFNPGLYRSRYNLPPRLETTLRYIFYALSLYHDILTGEASSRHGATHDGMHIPEAVHAELDRIVDMVVEARKRTVRVTWTWREFHEGYHECQYDESLLLQRFPPPPWPAETVEDRPISVLDRDGRLLYAYFPCVLNETRMKALQHAASKVFNGTHPYVQEMASGNVLEHTKVWPPSSTLRPGQLSLYPAGMTPQMPANHPPIASTIFSDSTLRPGAFDFLDSVDAETAGVLGAILALSSPNHLHVTFELFEALHTRRLVPHDEDLFDDIMSRWPFPFTDLYLQANSDSSDAHRSHFCPHSLNLYLSVGPSTTNRLKVSSLQGEFAFEPGTISIGFPRIFLSDLSPGGCSDQVSLIGSYSDSLRRSLTRVLHPLPFDTKDHLDYISHMFH
ncbi:hypothetical protein CC2G_002208 [Coprinopsis cinerea AmutBmut pab1-1]|nr:hypothetical protein CC2G_002208 [Coprinopsis cinerea AmutBmut pab1-1]